MSNLQNSQTPRSRVFVSSVVDGFKEYREVARRAIEKAGGEPILVNEDFPALDVSPRNACLDAVDSCDIYIIIIGQRGGWTTPSGMLVVEEEYFRAKLGKLPILAFLQRVERDADGKRLADLVEHYVVGALRATFQTPEELQRAIEQALKGRLSSVRSPKMNQDQFRRAFEDPFSIPNEASLRFVLAPERQEEVIDPVTLSSEEFIQRIYEISHSRQVRLFSYQQPKRTIAEEDALVIDQSNPHTGRDIIEAVRLKLSESGQMAIDANVTRRVRRGNAYGMLDAMVVAIEDIEGVLETDFRFVAAFYNETDKFKRHQRFFYNAAIFNLGHRQLVRNAKEQSSYTMNMLGGDKVVAAFPEARLVSRDDIEAPAAEIKRVITLLSKKVDRPTRTY